MSTYFFATLPAEWLVDPFVHLDHLLMSTRIGAVLRVQLGIDELVQTSKLHWTVRVYGFREVVGELGPTWSNLVRLVPGNLDGDMIQSWLSSGLPGLGELHEECRSSSFRHSSAWIDLDLWT